MTPLRAAIAAIRNWFGAASDVYTRYMLEHHLRFLAVTFAAILAVVTAINVSGEISRVWSEAAISGIFHALAATALYLLCRLLDNGSQVFGIAFLLGLVWAEAAHAHGGRLLMVRLAGRPFLRRSTALFVLAALSVPTQFTLDNVVRPWAFMTLSLKGLGEYGWGYTAARSPVQGWYAFDNAVLRATLHDSPEPVIERALLFYFDDRGGLASVATADRIVAPDQDRDRWTMLGAHHWRIGDPIDRRFGMPIGEPGKGTSELGFAISRVWLQYRGIEPKYIPVADLWRLTFDRHLPSERPKYGAWLAIRLTQCFIPGLVALCVGALFAMMLDRRGLMLATGVGLLAAYSGYFLNRISALGVENLHLPPAVTALVLPVTLAILVWRLIVRLRRYEDPTPSQRPQASWSQNPGISGA